MPQHKQLFTTILIILFLLVGCQQEEVDQATATPVPEVPVIEVATAVPTEVVPEPIAVGEVDNEPETAVLPATEGVFISEVLLGVPSSNQEEFIELYNAGSDPVDLQGYSLWYRMREDQDEQQLIMWENATLIPGQGHYLLVREGHDFGLIPDSTFSVPLFERNGGLRLLDAAETGVDQFGWGADAIADYTEGAPVTAEISGGSLERLPGGEQGNATTTDNNAADFVLTELPNPQNSGSMPAPVPANFLSIAVTAPDVLEPGSEFQYNVSVTNESDTIASNAIVSIPLPEYFEAVDLPETAVLQDGILTLELGELLPGDSIETAVSLTSPYTYIDTLISGYSVTADDFPQTFGPLQLVTMAGGSIPITTARELVGDTVTVEGIVTMYPGGFYAGSGSKFYLEDEESGIQVYMPSGLSGLAVNIGDQARVTGEIELYRDSIEIIPANMPDDVEIIQAGAAEPEPALITVIDNETNDAVLGRLNAIEGTATRVEEFSYSYEIDLTDDEGNTTLVYLEKDTGATTEPVDVGRDYRITGISEFYSTFRQLKPRLQTDIVEIFPPVLRLDLDVANNVEAGDLLTYTLTVYNQTDAPMTNFQITAVPPTNASIAEISNDGQLDGGQIIWNIDELAGEGAETAVQFSVQVEAGELVDFPAAAASADQWQQPALTQPFLTFIGSGVPIWAIQGSGETSPYVRSTVTTEGVVTAVFPELGGFWIQETVTDGDPATSAGILVLVDSIPDGLAVGDLIQVSGKVREASGQTLIQPPEPITFVTLSTGNPTPQPIAYTPPADLDEALLYNEALEGMLVTLDGAAVAIAPMTKYGEYVLVYETLGVDEIPRTETVGYMIMVDDGSMAAHEDASTLPYTVAKGDVVDNVTGPLAFTFDNYKIEPVAVPEIDAGQRQLASFPEPGTDEITVATFNVENLFDNKDPNPADPPKPSKAVYETKLNRIADVILAMGAPTIIGLQEVENIGVLEDLVALEQLADYQYQPALIEGTDPRGIDVAYLVRGDQAVIEGVAAYTAPDGLTSRPPLVITTTINLESEPETLYVLNNHFTSLAAGEAATEPRRTAQAAWNVAVMQQILANDPDAQIVVMGDLNSFYHTLPIDTLENAGLAHAFDIFGEDEALPYTYIFEGKTQSLDHILMTQNLFDRVGNVEALHINADYPLPLPDDDSPRRVSDHDPLVVRFSFSH